MVLDCFVFVFASFGCLWLRPCLSSTYICTVKREPWLVIVGKENAAPCTDEEAKERLSVSDETEGGSRRWPGPRVLRQRRRRTTDLDTNDTNEYKVLLVVEPSPAPLRRYKLDPRALSLQAAEALNACRETRHWLD